MAMTGHEQTLRLTLRLLSESSAALPLRHLLFSMSIIEIIVSVGAAGILGYVAIY